MSCSRTCSKPHYCPHFSFFCGQGCPSIIQKHLRKKTDVTSWSFYWAMSSRDRGGKLGAMSLKAREGFTKKCISSHLALTLITWYFSNLKCLYNFLPCRNFLFLKKRSTFIFLTNFFECILRLPNWIFAACL